MALENRSKHEVVGQFARHEGDTGSAEVQIALLTQRIGQLTEHFNTHRKDFHSRRGLHRLVGRRRRLLQYLKRENPTRYAKLIRELSIRGV